MYEVSLAPRANLISLQYILGLIGHVIFEAVFAVVANDSTRLTVQNVQIKSKDSYQTWGAPFSSLADR